VIEVLANSSVEQLAWLGVGACFAGAWVLDLATPTATKQARRKASREFRDRRRVAQVKVLWMKEETAIDYLMLQGLTKAAAKERYAKWSKAMNEAANGKGVAYGVHHSDPLDDMLSDLYA
jgi:hypothetical protein